MPGYGFQNRENSRTATASLDRHGAPPYHVIHQYYRITM
jgi:hypothetical protein